MEQILNWEINYITTWVAMDIFSKIILQLILSLATTIYPKQNHLGGADPWSTLVAMNIFSKIILNWLSLLTTRWRIQYYCKVLGGERYPKKKITLRHNQLSMISSENFALRLYTPLHPLSRTEFGTCDFMLICRTSSISNKFYLNFQ